MTYLISGLIVLGVALLSVVWLQLQQQRAIDRLDLSALSTRPNASTTRLTMRSTSARREISTASPSAW